MYKKLHTIHEKVKGAKDNWLLGLEKLGAQATLRLLLKKTVKFCQFMCFPYYDLYTTFDRLKVKWNSTFYKLITYTYPKVSLS